jgi:hypothetical protein
MPHPHSYANQPSLHLLRQTHVPTRHLINKLPRRIKQHNMKMLDRTHALQRSPITKPNHIFFSANASKHLSNKAIQLSSRLRQQIVVHSVRRRGELCPNDEMHDPRVDAVWPVVEQDFVVVFSGLMSA